MKSSIRLLLANHFSQLGQVRRSMRARLDAFQKIRLTYSQHSEDIFISDQLERYDFEHSIYIDVGANQPTSLSNTYLLYRRGMRGIVIEPNAELLPLYARVRPRDIAVGVGCGSQPELAKFIYYSTPVLNTYEPETVCKTFGSGPKVIRTSFLPILPLDLIVDSVDLRADYIAFLSVDTEGFDLAVLTGAARTLEQTLLVCVEANDTESGQEIGFLLTRFGFVESKRFGCNLIFKNQHPKFEQYRK